jgi:Putative zinc-finger
MISCRESARLISERRDRRLPWRTRVALRVHLFVCKLCQVYATQLGVVSRVSRVAGSAAPEQCPGCLPVERKQQIKDALSKNAP